MDAEREQSLAAKPNGAARWIDRSGHLFPWIVVGLVCVGASIRIGVALATHAEAADRLEHPVLPIVGRVNRKGIEYRRRHPASTDLVPWKARAIQHDDVETRVPQSEGARRARGPAPHDQHITALAGHEAA